MTQSQVFEEKFSVTGFGSHDSSFSVGKANPWHRAGVVFENAPSVKEGITQAGLDWKVALQDTQTVSGIALPQKAVVRTDINLPIGMVSKQYTPLQNEDAFDFFQDFIDSGVASLETAGSLQNGRRVFILAKIANMDMYVTDDDVVQSYLLLSNSHDGSAAVYVGYTPIRVICQNTLTIATTNKAARFIKIYHHGNVNETLNQVKDTMDIVNKQFIATQEKYKELVQITNISSESVRKYLKSVFSIKDLEKSFEDNTEIPESELEQERSRLIKRVEEIWADDLVKVGDNAWTLYNSVNYYLNHESGRTIDGNRNSLMFGNNAKRDRIALNEALKLGQ